jgi:hypothetical protein
MSEITVEPNLEVCSEIWKLYVEGKSHAAIAQHIGLDEGELWRIYRYLNLHSKSINPNSGDGATQFFVLFEQYRSQYEMCNKKIKEIDGYIAECESMKDITGLLRVQATHMTHKTTISKNLQGLLGMDTINVRLLSDFEQKKEGTRDYSEMSQNELMQELTKKLSQ